MKNLSENKDHPQLHPCVPRMLGSGGSLAVGREKLPTGSARTGAGAQTDVKRWRPRQENGDHRKLGNPPGRGVTGLFPPFPLEAGVAKSLFFF